MATESEKTPTELLAAARGGDGAAQKYLTASVYADLRRLAGGQMCAERRDHTLTPTALVNEVAIRVLEKSAKSAFDNIADRAHFFRVAAKVMRQLLVDHARHRGAKKRSGSAKRVPLDDMVAVFQDNGIDLQGLDKALKELKAVDERQHNFLDLRYFLGKSCEEIGRLEEVSGQTVRNQVKSGEAWLRARLSGGVAGHGE